MIDIDSNRYFPPEALTASLKQARLSDRIKIEGYSEEKREIKSLTLGSGVTKILAWSQMHGNETTTTKALFDVIDFLENTTEGKELLKKIRLKLIFQLNPDGAKRYTRTNANEVDLNRDAQLQTQSETQILMRVYNTFNPALCLNLHGQRTIFSVGDSNKPASLSFLAPAADAAKKLTTARLTAMQLISAIAAEHNLTEKWGIGRYDDSFNLNCTGDYFTAKGTPVILIEAGHFPQDYVRKTTRTLIAKSIISCIESLTAKRFQRFKQEDYNAIPENGNHLRDIEITNVTIVNNEKITKTNLFVQYKETLKEDKVIFYPEFAGSGSDLVGLAKIEMHENQELHPIDLTKSGEEIVNLLKLQLDF